MATDPYRTGYYSLGRQQPYNPFVEEDIDFTIKQPEREEQQQQGGSQPNSQLMEQFMGGGTAAGASAPGTAAPGGGAAAGGGVGASAAGAAGPGSAGAAGGGLGAAGGAGGMGAAGAAGGAGAGGAAGAGAAGGAGGAGAGAGSAGGGMGGGMAAGGWWALIVAAIAGKAENTRKKSDISYADQFKNISRAPQEDWDEHEMDDIFGSDFGDMYKGTFDLATGDFSNYWEKDPLMKGLKKSLTFDF